jgi:tetratricopeptide (TPR) repeat protein
MKFSPPVILALALFALAISSPAQVAGTDEAADKFFSGYVLKNDAEKLEQEGNLQGALSLYQKMKEAFDAVAQTHPEWQTSMLSNRRALTDQSIARVQARLSQPAVAQVPVAASVTAPAPLGAPTVFGLSTGTPVPAPGTVTMPAPAATGATPGGFPSLAETLAQWEAAFRQRMTALEQQNGQMQGDLSKWQQWYQWASSEITTTREKQKGLEEQIATKNDAISSMKLEVAAGRATQQQLDTLTKEKIGIEVEYKKAVQRLAAAEGAAKEASVKLVEASERIAIVEAERNKILGERDAAVKERDAKAVMLSETEKKADTITKERDSLSAQVLGFKTQIEGLTKKTPAGSSAEMKKLLAENDRLKSELEAAQMQIVTLKSDATRKDQEIATLRTQLTSLQGEITTLRQQSAAYQSQVADLTLQLKKMQEIQPGMTPELAKENTLLREIIMRQLRSQYRQQQAKDLVIAELKKMEGVSLKLMEQVEDLQQSRLSLTPEEEKLFTDPSVRELLGSDGIQGTLIARVSKPADGAEKPAMEANPVVGILEKANEAFGAKRFPEAAALYEDALRADPKNTGALVGLGFSREREQKYLEAETALKKCLLLEPNNETAAFHLGVTYFKQGRWNDAMSSFDKSLTLNPKNARGRHYLGIISTKLNFIERAEREFKTALAIDPNYGEAHFNLAVLYATWDPPQWEKARSEYSQALKQGVTPDENLEKLLKSDAPKSESAS